MCIRDRFNTTNSGYENEGVGVGICVFSREVFEGGDWILTGCQIWGMSGDTYLFRRSPSIDRLGPDLSKLSGFGYFGMLEESMDRGMSLYLPTLRMAMRSVWLEIKLMMVLKVEVSEGSLYAHFENLVILVILNGF